MVAGDELKLKFSGDAHNPPWSSLGHVVTIRDNEEVALELRGGGAAPIESTHGFSLEVISLPSCAHFCRSLPHIRALTGGLTCCPGRCSLSGNQPPSTGCAQR
jgi:hypothetical protein